jgi:hypothetical protein
LGELGGDETEISQSPIALDDLRFAEAVCPHQRPREQALSQAKLDTLIRRAQLTLQQIHDRGQLVAARAIEQLDDEVNGAEAATGCFQLGEVVG